MNEKEWMQQWCSNELGKVKLLEQNKVINQTNQLDSEGQKQEGGAADSMWKSLVCQWACMAVFRNLSVKLRWRKTEIILALSTFAINRLILREHLYSLNWHTPDLHSGQTNFPFGASAREMQARWKAPQHCPSQRSSSPVFSHTWDRKIPFPFKDDAKINVCWGYISSVNFTGGAELLEMKAYYSKIQKKYLDMSKFYPPVCLFTLNLLWKWVFKLL